ncbi:MULTISPECIES: chemotaxis protein CheW [unclassified Fusibacter]|uniref:chemotaxis protein CheW n=1 Tax=unclassified Fusibacter TaxID=2624464 RepID=UPI0010124B88|nr:MULTISPECIES: chemotaxis protein CheW [unclassified Fusibacter]MCK8061009.1 chemotaxis protein CheW [Fusibacter sp. A2]NPE20537.1 purine-binding chemotaxis protein CheW [Fusibacter sp. A1]RXV63735.1 chemotaxis protein CheW [Fusibacter sp. A1]
MAEMQYVVFKLGEERFCVEISNVSGITEYKEITGVPNSPSYIEGVVNLRGDIIPVVNLKKRFVIEETKLSEETRIININFNGKDIGFLVDEASQVLRITDDNIEPAPEIIKGKGGKYISGIAKIDDQIAIVLDLENIFDEEERALVMGMKEE